MVATLWSFEDKKWFLHELEATSEIPLASCSTAVNIMEDLPFALSIWKDELPCWPNSTVLYLAFSFASAKIDTCDETTSAPCPLRFCLNDALTCFSFFPFFLYEHLKERDAVLSLGFKLKSLDQAFPAKQTQVVWLGEGKCKLQRTDSLFHLESWSKQSCCPGFRLHCRK